MYNDRTVRIITMCRGVTSLTFWAVPHTWPSTIGLPHQKIAAALGSLRPKKLSLLLDGALCSPCPQFEMPFFQKITHLSIVNKWEDWSTWWGFELLPCLTHLSFDLRIGPKALDDKTASTISQMIQDVLSRCVHLRVCILLLIFDTAPTFTAATITNKMETSDPRLVFMRDTEPFLYREAHSTREAEIWKLATQTAIKQQDSRAGSRIFLFSLLGTVTHRFFGIPIQPGVWCWKYEIPELSLPPL